MILCNPPFFRTDDQFRHESKFNLAHWSWRSTLWSIVLLLSQDSSLRASQQTLLRHHGNKVSHSSWLFMERAHINWHILIPINTPVVVGFEMINSSKRHGLSTSTLMYYVRRWSSYQGENVHNTLRENRRRFQSSLQIHIWQWISDSWRKFPSKLLVLRSSPRVYEVATVKYRKACWSFNRIG